MRIDSPLVHYAQPSANDHAAENEEARERYRRRAAINHAKGLTVDGRARRNIRRPELAGLDRKSYKARYMPIWRREMKEAGL